MKKTNKLNEIKESYSDIEFMSADGFDDAVIGVYGNNWNNCEPVLAYSQKKCIEILMKDMSYTEAMEYFEFNTIGAYMGVKTPIFIDDMHDFEGNVRSNEELEVPSTDGTYLDVEKELSKKGD